MADTLSSTGLEIDDLQTRISRVISQMRSRVSPVETCPADDPTGQATRITSEKVQQIAELCAVCLAAFDPDQAQGLGLDSLAALTGVVRCSGDGDYTLRQDREDDLAETGGATADAIADAVGDVSGVEEVLVLKNALHYTVDTIPANSIETVYWSDGLPAAATVTAIAEAIFETIADGVTAHGTDIDGLGTATETVSDDYGNDTEIGATRADEKVVEVEYTLTTDSTYPGDSAFKSAIETWADGYFAIGGDVYATKLIDVAFDVEGVTNVTSLRLRFQGDAWGVIDLTVATREIATIAAANVTVL